MRIKALILTSLLSIMSIVSLPSWSHEMHSHHQKAQDDLTVMVNLTKDKTPSAVMAIGFAIVSLNRSNKAAIWINSEGVRLADAEGKPSQAVKMLQEFIAKGGKVYVCHRSAKMLEVKELVKGAEFGEPDTVFGVLSEEQVKSYILVRRC